MTEGIAKTDEENLAPAIATDSATLLLSKSADPASEAALVVSAFGGSVRSLLEGCVRIVNAVDTYRGDRERENAFLDVLVLGRVLPRAEAQLGLAASPKISKLCAIGMHAEILGHPDVLPLLATGYSICYGATVLFKALDGDEAARVAEFARILGGCDGPLSREFLADAAKEVRRKSQNARSAVGTDPARTPAELNADAADTDPSNIVVDVSPIDDGEDATLADLLLVTPTADDFRLSGETYPAPDALELALPLHKWVAPRAAVIIFAQLHHLPIIQNVLLPLAGFSGRSRVLLLRRPEVPDVTAADVVVTAVRGGMRLQPVDDLWDGDDIDPTAIASRLVPEAVNRLHAFAESKTVGWRSLIGDDTWTERPSI